MSIIYKPWIGKNYGKSDYGKLLIIGDSHYFLNDEDESVFPNFTIDIVSELEDKNFNFYRKIGNIFNTDKNTEIWDNVAFANAIQTPFRSSDQIPTDVDFKTVEPAILSYLNIVQPTRMIVFSQRVWENGLPTDISWGEFVETLSTNNKSATVWKFNYDNGVCFGLGVHHPSYMKFKSDEWKPIIDLFLTKDYQES